MSETTNFHRSENPSSRPCYRVLCIFTALVPLFSSAPTAVAQKRWTFAQKAWAFARNLPFVFQKSAQLFSKRCLERVKSGDNGAQNPLIYNKMRISILYSSLRTIGLTQVGSATHRRAHFNPRAATSGREFGPRSCLTPQKKERIFTLKIKSFP